MENKNSEAIKDLMDQRKILIWKTGSSFLFDQKEVNAQIEKIDILIKDLSKPATAQS